MFQPDYKKLAEISNMGRNGPDMFDSWDSVMDVVNFYGKNEGHFAELAGPGYFNDPDEVGVAGKMCDCASFLMLKMKWPQI